MFERFMKEYVNDLISALNSIDASQLEEIAVLVNNTIKDGKKIFMMGNGGSSATSSHSAGDFSKELGARVICLSDNISVLTAWANDVEYENIFRGQLETFLDEGDLVMGYSGSGNSPNVINAITFANDVGAYTVGITGNYMGRGGGKITEVAQKSIVFNTESMERIEDMQIIINHIIKEAVKTEYFV